MNDRHSIPAAVPLRKLWALVDLLRWKQATWDEISLTTLWRGRGYINYCTLVGIPDPQDLQPIDSALQSLVLQSLRVRPCAERASLLAPLRAGGLQFPSIVESTVVAVAKGLSNLFNGDGIASDLARDSLRHAMGALKRRYLQRTCVSGPHLSGELWALRNNLY